VDYTSNPIIATFNAGTNSTTINIPVTKDDIAEKSETFNLVFTIPSSLHNRVTPGTISTATATITDNTGENILT